MAVNKLPVFETSILMYSAFTKTRLLQNPH